jgi:valyl-tRNA synthetase
MVVERQLAKENKTRHDLGRTAFVERVWEWKHQSDGTIKQQMRRLGNSMDWTRERFTLDENICEAVKTVFIQLYNEGLIYRGKRLVNWDPVLLTAVSDLEVISEDQPGSIWYIRYPLAEKKGDQQTFITVATTRPETLLGDVAVAVHPDDERYRSFIGKQMKLPLTERLIPIIADPMVEKDFGTGCVKITPAHDFNDYAMGQRHQLPLINILTPDAHLNENVPAVYRGLERFAARKQILADLTALNLLEKTEPHTLKLPRGDRSGAIIEPYLTDQWFVKTKPLAEVAIAAVKQGEIKFVPENWQKTYFKWLENIEDWCISRQLWWGHRIPAWYDQEGKVYVGDSEMEVRVKHQINPETSLTQDDDVLDTWFSSALWPFTTLGWPEQTQDLETFYPTDVLVTGFDIIFFWVARMIMMGLKFTGKVPFREVYITGLIRDSEGQKMSKSKGNILDPIDIIDGISQADLIKKRTQGLMQPALEKKIIATTMKEFPEGIPTFGTDALRFTFCALASTGRDIHFDLNRTAGYRNFCNKLWNASRYVLMNIENFTADLTSKEAEFSLADRWIRSRLQESVQQVKDAFQQYRFDILAQTIYEFTWNEYCDWYLELSKPILTTAPQSKAAIGTRQTLVYVLETILRLTHPLMPFITEEIWQSIGPLAGKQGATIMLQTYPEVDTQQQDQAAVQEIEWLKNIITAIRTVRSEMNISPAKLLPMILYKANDADIKMLIQHQELIKRLAKVEQITKLDGAIPNPAATTLVNELELFIPLAELIDTQAEVTRLTKEISKLAKELERSETKLNNADYVAKAPVAIVEKERARVHEMRNAMQKLDEQLQKVKESSLDEV